jgi:hypothetical protein
MSPISTPLVGTYDYRVVAVSLLLAVITSYAALDIAGRLSCARGLARLAWLGGGALAMGIGFWTSQFMGMAAYQPSSADEVLLAFRCAFNDCGNPGFRGRSVYCEPEDPDATDSDLWQPAHGERTGSACTTSA